MYQVGYTEQRVNVHNNSQDCVVEVNSCRQVPTSFTTAIHTTQHTIQNKTHKLTQEVIALDVSVAQQRTVRMQCLQTPGAAQSQEHPVRQGQREGRAAAVGTTGAVPAAAQHVSERAVLTYLQHQAHAEENLGWGRMASRYVVKKVRQECDNEVIVEHTLGVPRPQCRL